MQLSVACYQARAFRSALKAGGICGTHSKKMSCWYQIKYQHILSFGHICVSAESHKSSKAGPLLDDGCSRCVFNRMGLDLSSSLEFASFQLCGFYTHNFSELGIDLFQEQSLWSWLCTDIRTAFVYEEMFSMAYSFNVGLILVDIFRTVLSFAFHPICHIMEHLKIKVNSAYIWLPCMEI